MAILADNKNIIFKDIEIDLDNRVVTTNFRFKDLMFQVTNIYASPNLSDRKLFFDKWLPQLNKDSINIIADDFNTNLYPEKDRISEATPQQDITRIQLLDLIKNFTDSSDIAKSRGL